MREGRPSFTAAAVATARGIARVDPLAEALVSGPLALVLRAGRGGAARATAVNAATLGLVDHVEMRTRAIDAALRDGAAAGIRQLVVLGAGLDARAWRMPELADVTVFEVDHPSTQGYKRRRVEGRAASAREVRFVAVDFERDALGEVLARAGHDADAPTFWIWEGVTPYLGLDAIRATLAAIGARSAPGSRLAVTYGTRRGSPLGPAAMRVARVGFRLIGEELRGLLDVDEMRAELARAGLRVVDDASARDWASRHGGGKLRFLFVDERLAVAERDAPDSAAGAGGVSGGQARA